jgi:phage/plasmid-associated DNA primase
MYAQYRDHCEKNGYRSLGERSFGKEVRRTFTSIQRARRGSRTERFWAYEGLERVAETVGMF